MLSIKMLVFELVGRGKKRTASSTERVRLVMAFAKGRCTLRCCKLSAFRSKVAVVEQAVLDAGLDVLIVAQGVWTKLGSVFVDSIPYNEVV